MNFDYLIQNITTTDKVLHTEAAKAINKALTARNWLIGLYIVEFEQNGEDRAKYGKKLLENLAKKLNSKGLSFRNLKLFRQFYLEFPQLSEPIKLYLVSQSSTLKLSNSIGQSLIAQLQVVDSQLNTLKPQQIFDGLSYTHLTELLHIKEPLKRTFYEMECIKGVWTHRELQRQIHSLYFERMGLSAQPEKLATLVQNKNIPATPIDLIKDEHIFEFLGLSHQLLEESTLENALLDHLQEFMLELGNGFCLEARQKRILIGEEYYYLDLLFYHKILKCQILIDLKVEKFNHAHAGQMTTYLNYFKETQMTEGDNPPIGILLVTEKDKALVHFATAGNDNLLVSNYQLYLPTKEQLEEFIEKEMKLLE
ncbi:PDDEXK nuclease domain-containing protein [Emticicia sp. SJ17W-69]|uniref:PDDEXK nuclease domain-containing protein n=1 Tax=Emticicia sp. SJ17W-69 TaxID=3421657 RepID=UPI003EBA35D2